MKAKLRMGKHPRKYTAKVGVNRGQPEEGYTHSIACLGGGGGGKENCFSMTGYSSLTCVKVGQKKREKVPSDAQDKSLLSTPTSLMDPASGCTPATVNVGPGRCLLPSGWGCSSRQICQIC